jgi:hypothetical protein
LQVGKHLRLDIGDNRCVVGFLGAADCEENGKRRYREHKSIAHCVISVLKSALAQRTPRRLQGIP